MSRLILHVGMAKTGTTAIQTFAANNRQELIKRGLWYPDYKPVSDLRQNAHHAFAHSLAGMGHHLSIEQSKTLVDSWHEKTQGSKHDLMLSSEGMSNRVIGKPEENWLEKRRRYVQTLGGILAPFDVVVVMVLRRQDEFARSMYQEYVSGGFWATRLWVDADLHRKSVWAHSFPRYRKVLEESVLHYLNNLLLYEEVFGRPDVLLFDDLIKTGHLSSAFLKELGVNTEGLVDPGMVRRSPSYEETLIKSRLWLLTARARTNKRINRFVKWTTEEMIHPYFGESRVEELWENGSARADFMKNYSEENAKIASRYFPQRSLPLFK